MFAENGHRDCEKTIDNGLRYALGDELEDLPERECGKTGKARLWLTFLMEATRGDQELIRYLQRMAGYSLTGDVSEHALFFIYGAGGNGKGVFLNTLTAIFGDYVTVSTMETFAASRSDRHMTDVAMLRGARLVTAQETEEGRAWNEARIKALTGGDPITARFMRCDNFTFTPTFKLVIAGNHKPALRVVDDAARRRFNIIPFTNSYFRHAGLMGDQGWRARHHLSAIVAASNRAGC